MRILVPEMSAALEPEPQTAPHRRQRASSPAAFLVVGWALFILSGMVGGASSRLKERDDLVLLCLGPALMAIGLIVRKLQTRAGGRRDENSKP